MEKISVGNRISRKATEKAGHFYLSQQIRQLKPQLSDDVFIVPKYFQLKIHLVTLVENLVKCVPGWREQTFGTLTSFLLFYRTFSFNNDLNSFSSELLYYSFFF